MDFAISSLPLPARIIPESPLSDDELLRFCEANKGLRIEKEADGELLIMTPTGLKGFTMNERIVRYLGNWAEEDGRGISGGPDAGYRLPDGSMRSPDASWFSAEKRVSLSEEEQEQFPRFCPEFVIELQSPGDRAGAMKKKMEMWIANGAEVAWLIEPKARTVTIYRRGEEPEILMDPTSVQGSGPVRGFELVMGRVWG
jgi:Uma2 family endonuclease